MSRLFHPFFSADALLRAAAAVYALAAPRSFLSWFVAQPDPGLAVDVVRCFGALLLAMAYIEWRALERFSRSPLVIVLQGLILADLAFLTNFLAIPQHARRWTAADVVTVIMTLALIFVRAWFLALPRTIREAPPPRVRIPQE